MVVRPRHALVSRSLGNGPRASGWRRWGQRALRALLCVAAFATTSCEKPDPRALLKLGEERVLAGQFHEAMDPLKQCLLLEPYNAGAHYYLGQAYLNAQFHTVVPPWRLTVALGELDTALAHFQSQGRPAVLDRFTPDEFEVSCHLKKAQVYMRRLQLGVSNGVRVASMAGLLNSLQEEANAARAIMPDSADVAQLDQLIDNFKSMDQPVRPLTPPASPLPPPALADPGTAAPVI